MRKFEFPLESVLRLRRFREAEARQALAEAIAAYNEAEEALNLTRRRIADVTTFLSGGLQVLHAGQLVNAWVELDLLEQTALKQQAILAEKELVVSDRREDYLAAQQERKPLDRLKDEMRLAFTHEADLVEQSTMEELAMVSYSRRGREP